MLARHKLKTRGFIVLYHAVPVDRMRSVSRDSSQTFWINDTWDGAIQDDYRFRSFVPDWESRELSLDLQRFYKTNFPRASTLEWRFLKTAGGAEDQLIRREFATGEGPMDVCSIPGSLLIAAQNSTYFYGYGWNQKYPLQSDQQIIELNKGDVIMLRGDYLLARAGSAFTNVCIHAYVDTPLYARPTYHFPEFHLLEDDTRDTDDVFSYVWKCPYISKSQKALQKHLNNYHDFYSNHPQRMAP